MSTKQRLLFITTGGTIASVRTQQGLKPVLTSEELLAHLPELNELCCPDTLALCSIDSTDLGPEHWLMMAKAVQENYALYDGFIICHGTDTLAYSAAALSYLIQNADKPVILTGAQQPISNEITDAKKNLRDSVICALDSGSRGVMVVDHFSIVECCVLFCQLRFFCKLCKCCKYFIIYCFCSVIVSKILCHRNAVILNTFCSVLTGHHFCKIDMFYFRKFFK